MKNEIEVQLEYRVKKVERFIVQRFTRVDGNSTGTSETRGEYDNPELAQEVAYALCKREHEALGWEIGDMRIRYPSMHGDVDLSA